MVTLLGYTLHVRLRSTNQKKLRSCGHYLRARCDLRPAIKPQNDKPKMSNSTPHMISCLRAGTSSARESTWGLAPSSLEENFLFQSPTHSIHLMSTRWKARAAANRTSCLKANGDEAKLSHIVKRSLWHQHVLTPEGRLHLLHYYTVFNSDGSRVTLLHWRSSCCLCGFCDVNSWLLGQLLYEKCFWKQHLLYNVPTQHCTRGSSYLIFTHEAKYEKRRFTPKTDRFPTPHTVGLRDFFQHRSQMLF